MGIHLSNKREGSDLRTHGSKYHVLDFTTAGSESSVANAPNFQSSSLNTQQIMLQVVFIRNTKSSTPNLLLKGCLQTFIKRKGKII